MGSSSSSSEKAVVLITGCGRGGIGYEYCKAFADHGCHVVATDLPSRLHELSDLLSAGDVEGLELDVSSDESVGAAVAEVITRLGRIDVVVNNAGVGCTGPLAELGLDEARRAWEVNVLGQLRVVQAVAPHMAARRGGRIVNVGSVAGGERGERGGRGGDAVGGVVLAAVHAMSVALRLELRPFGVHVVKVVPGAVRSNLGRANSEALLQRGRRWEMYGEFAEAIAGRATASQTGKATEAAALARVVARKVLSRRPPRQIVFGHMAGLFAALSWSPLWARDLFLAHRFGLRKKKLA